MLRYGPLAQVVEHLTFNQVVRGSSPRCLMSECKEVPENGTSFFSNIKGYNIENSYKKLSIFYIACKKIVYYVRI